MWIFTTTTFFGRLRHLFEDATLDVECWAVSNHILHTELGVSIDLPTHDLDMPRGLSHLAGWQHFCQHKNSFRNSFIPPHSSNEIIFGISSSLELLSLSNTSNFFELKTDLWWPTHHQIWIFNPNADRMLMTGLAESHFGEIISWCWKDVCTVLLSEFLK